MQLDNIIYDKDTLADAIATQWNLESETFQAIYPSETATSLVYGMAAYGSMLQYMLVSQLANCYTDTAFSPNAIYQLAATLGNSLHGNSPSHVTAKMIKNNLVFLDTTIPANTQFEIDGKKFYNPSAILFPSGVEMVTDIALVQGEVIEVEKFTSGRANEKLYFSSDFLSDNETVRVFVNGDEWNVLDSFIPIDQYGVVDSSEMNSVVLKTTPDGRSYIKLGNGSFGTLPAADTPIKIRYVSNLGSQGDIEETNVEGNLLSALTFVDNHGKSENLDLTIVTTTPAFGGFDTQSTELLAQTSPAIFGSGHRAVRRKDYRALLQNKCGYLTCNVWGEYEEAKEEGIQDAIMMNVVYYTGIKSFEQYPFFEVGNVTDASTYKGTAMTSRGFYGSYAVRFTSGVNDTAHVVMKDNQGNGLLFINNDNQDPRDDLLPDWIDATSEKTQAKTVTVIAGEGGIGYVDSEQFTIQPCAEEEEDNRIVFKVNVTDLNADGSVKDGSSLTILSAITTLDIQTGDFDAIPVASTAGSGLKVHIEFEKVVTDDLVSVRYVGRSSSSEPLPVSYHEISNCRSDKSSNVYFKSLYAPTLLHPVQIILSFPEPKSIAGVKFKATPQLTGSFLGKLAIYATTEEQLPKDSIDNIKNNTKSYDKNNKRWIGNGDWIKVSDKIELSNPYGNGNGNWTDWVSTKCFTGEVNLTGEPIYDEYRHYVIEVYSPEAGVATTSLFTLDSIKVMYSDSASEIFYADNGLMYVDFPEKGDAGPSGLEGSSGIPDSLMNVGDFYLWQYKTEVKNVTGVNGYKNGDKLGYVYHDDELDLTTPFVVNVIDVDQGSFIVTSENSNVLIGKSHIETAEPIPLINKLYEGIGFKDLDGRISPIAYAAEGLYLDVSEAVGYKNNDIVILNGTEGEYNLPIRARVNVRNEQIISVSILDDISYSGEIEGDFETTWISGVGVSSSEAHGLKLLKISCKPAFHNVDDEGNPASGNGGTINIESLPNVMSEVSFTGNRIENAAIDSIDQPIMNKYNHFTTWIEFKQPKINSVDVAVKACLDANASLSTVEIIQNIKNAIQNLFKITPNYMGSGLKISDIYKALLSVEGVKYGKVITPADNIVTLPNALMVAGDITVSQIVENYNE